MDYDVIEYLSGPPYIKYSTHSTSLKRKGDNDEEKGSEMEVLRSKDFSTNGARSIENAGPLQDLMSKLIQEMRPWQSEKILHVGLTKRGFEEKLSIRTNTAVVETTSLKAYRFKPLIYFQWCSYNESLSHQSSQYLDSPVGYFPEEIASSEACSTIWSGSIVYRG